MNTTSATYSTSSASSGGLSLPRKMEAWLDARGRKAWIIAMVLSFIVFWPVGVALAFYITATHRWSHTHMFARSSSRSSNQATQWRGMRATRSSGNAAFDAYKADTLRKLEEEQEAFEAFLQRLRDSKDKSEFDTFMEDRANSARTAPVEAADIARPGEY